MSVVVVEDLESLELHGRVERLGGEVDPRGLVESQDTLLLLDLPEAG